MVSIRRVLRKTSKFPISNIICCHYLIRVFDFSAILHADINIYKPISLGGATPDYNAPEFLRKALADAVNGSDYSTSQYSSDTVSLY